MPETSLDDAAIYDELDSEGLLGRIAALPEQIADAWAAGRALDLPWTARDIDQVVLLGMGGSGIGGLLLQALAHDTGASVPIAAVRGYRIPPWMSSRTMVIASSNSGNTEETVGAFFDALSTGAKCLAITTGGRLLASAQNRDAATLTYEWGDEPRSALGWSFASLLAICGRLGVMHDFDAELPAALDEMRALGGEIARDVPESANAAKQLARRLSGRLPVFVGAESLAPVAYRWRTQLNENAKSWAIADELPEFNHNAQTAFGLPQRVVPLLHAVMLRHASVHPRIALRFDATADEMRRNGVSCEIVDVTGGGLLAQVLRGVLLGDYTSYYLGLLNGVHPSPVPALGVLKDLLAGN